MRYLAHLGRLPEYGVYAAVLLVPLVGTTTLFSSPEIPKHALAVFLALLALLTWAGLLLLKGRFELPKAPWNLPLLGLLLLVLVSAVFSVAPVDSWLGSYGSPADGLLALLASLVFFSVIVYRKRLDPDALLHVASLSSSGAALLGLLSFFGLLRFAAGGGGVLFAAFLVLLVASRTPKNAVWRGVLALSLITLLVLSDSVAGWTTLGAGMVLLLAVEAWRRPRAFPFSVRLSAAAGLLLLSVLFAATLSSPLKDAREHQPSLPLGLSWQAALLGLADGPKQALVGAGPGAFDVVFAKERPTETGLPSRPVRSSSFAAETLAAAGLLGAAAWGLLMFFAVRSFLNSEPQRAEFAFAVAASSLFAAQFVSEQTTPLQVLFWVFAGTALVPKAGVSPVYARTLPRVLSKPLVQRGVFTLILLLFLVSGGLLARQLAANAAWTDALKARDTELARVQGLRAVSLEPWRAELRVTLAQTHTEEVTAALAFPEAEQNEARLSESIRRGIEQLTKALELAPSSVAAQEALGNLYGEIRSAPGAADWGVRAFERAVELEPSNPAHYVQLGQMELARGEGQKALEAFDRALGLREEDRDALLQKAKLLGEPGLLLSLASRFSADEEVQFELGRLYFNQGNLGRAEEQFLLVLQIVPTNSNARYALATTYEKQGRISLALRELERVLELNPEAQEVKERLERLSPKK